MNTIIGIFDDAAQARRAMETLRDSSLPLDDVSIISRRAGTDASDNPEDVSAGEGAAVGAVWGGLVGLASLLIPGVGPFIAGGALFAALTGAVTGAVVGGIAAALIDFSGIPEAEARGYEEQVRAGKTLVAVRARDEDSAEVRRMLETTGADVRDAQRSIAEKATAGRPTIAMYDESGRRVSDDMEHAAGDATGAAADASTGIASTSPALTGTPAAGTAAASMDATSTTTRRRGIYDVSDTGGTAGTPGHTWTRGEWMGEGQDGPRKDTGKYDARQWVGEGQGESGHQPDDAKQWTSGEWVGEGQGSGPRKDTGEFDADQWVGEGQGDRPATDSPATDSPTKKQP